MSQTLTDYLDRIAQFAHERYRVEMAEARRDYFRQIGANPENQDYYEEIIKAYLDWFLYERPLEESAGTPLQVFVRELTGELSEDDAVVYNDLLKARHSLFMVRKTKPESVECVDLLTGEVLTVAEDSTGAFMKGEVFDARILPFHGEWRFGELLRFHPKRAAKLIKNVADGIRRTDGENIEGLFLRLAQCKIKHYLFPRIDPLQFYREIL